MHFADVVRLAAALRAPAQGQVARGVLRREKPIRRPEQREREQQAHGSALQAWSSRAKYQGLRAASPCDSGMVSVPGRRNASG